MASPAIQNNFCRNDDIPYRSAVHTQKYWTESTLLHRRSMKLSIKVLFIANHSAVLKMRIFKALNISFGPPGATTKMKLQINKLTKSKICGAIMPPALVQNVQPPMATFLKFRTKKSYLKISYGLPTSFAPRIHLFRRLLQKIKMLSFKIFFMSYAKKTRMYVKTHEKFPNFTIYGLKQTVSDLQECLMIHLQANYNFSCCN